jgi:hypothetical protein
MMKLAAQDQYCPGETKIGIARCLVVAAYEF